MAKDGSMQLHDIVEMTPAKIKIKSQTQTDATPETGTAVRTPTVDSNNSIPQSSPLSQENFNKPYAISRTLPRAGENSSVVLPTAKEQMESAQRQRRAAEAKTETERTGILYGATEENIQMAGRISKAINREVLFYENADPNVENDEGFYKDGKIYINAKSKNSVAYIIAHEMTHSIELADAYIDLCRTVVRHIQKSGGSIADMRSELKNRYENNGVKLSSTGEVNVEVVAEYIADHLLTDEASITSLAAENRKGASAILRFLDNLLAKLGNTNARERVFVENARKFYAMALRQKGSMENAEQRKGETKAAQRQTEAEKETATRAEDNRTELRTAREEIEEAYARGEMTEEEYSEKMDTFDTEESMAGESMLYEDGRQFSIEKEKGVEKQSQNHYNNTNHEIGGVTDERKVGHDNLRGRSKGANPGKQGTTGKTDSAGIKGNGEEAGLGIYRGRGRENLYINDSEGRRISAEDAEKLRDTAITDKEGNPLAVYHFTAEMNFTIFAKGDTGFHFGNEAQARKRAEDLGEKKGRIFRAYLDIKNPIRFRLDINSWVPSHTGLYLWSEGILTDAEWNEVRMLPGSEYTSQAAVRLREILENKRYDGFIYPNGVEGEGDSYLAFRDEQIIKTDIENIDLQKNDTNENIQYAIAKDSAAETAAERPFGDVHFLVVLFTLSLLLRVISPNGSLCR